MKISKHVISFVLLTSSVNVSAAIVSVDWQVVGDNLITQDTVSGLEWLDLTATTNRSFNEVSAQFGLGGEFEGWRYASYYDVIDFFDAFGGNSDYYRGYSAQNNGLFDAISAYWGDTHCAVNGCAVGTGSSRAILGTSPDGRPEAKLIAAIADYAQYSVYDHEDFIHTGQSTFTLDDSHELFGHALVREISAVPVPAAVWLFGSGLLGLVGVARYNLR